MSKITLFGWKRTYFHKYSFDTIPQVRFEQNIGSNAFVSLLTPKYGFIMERQLRVLDMHNVPKGYIWKIVQFLKYNNKQPQIIKVKDAFKQIVRYGKQVKHYPYPEDGVGHLHFYKFIFDTEILDTVNVVPQFQNYIIAMKNIDIEKEVDNYINNTTNLMSQTINSG